MKVLVLLLVCVAVLSEGRPSDEQSSDKKQQEERSSKRASTYAFSAELEEDREINEDITLVFGKTLTNSGSLYHGTSGQFVCDNDDVHVFLWSTSNMKGYVTRNELMLQRTGQDVKFGPKPNCHGSYTGGVATMLAVIPCAIDPVFQNAVSVRTVTKATYAAGYTTFSGFRLAPQRSAIAFTADLPQRRKIFPNQRISFDRVLQNFGGAYDPINGFFRCPDSGLYAFFVSAQTEGPYDSRAQWASSLLMLHDKVVMAGPETYRSVSHAESGSSSTLTTLQCQQGRDVYVNSNQTYTYEFNIYGEALTSFSGFRLFREGESAAVAFTAVLSEDHVFGSVERTLVFDKVITNVGAAYYAVVGIFVCPDSDAYLFSWTAASNIGGSQLQLHYDDVPVKTSYYTTQYASEAYGSSGSSTMAVILQCVPTKRVQVVSGPDTVTNTVYLAQLTSFSGFKIPDYYE